MLGTFDAPTRRDTRSLFDGLAKSLETRDDELNTSLALTEPFVRSAAELTSELAGQTAVLRRFFQQSRATYATIGQREGALRALLDAGEDALDVTARRRAGVTATTRALAPFLAELQRASLALSSAAPELARATRSLLPVAGTLSPALEQTRSFAPEVEKLLEELPGTLRAGQKGLPALTRLQRAERPAFQALYPAFRQLIPVMELFAENRRSTYGVLANTGSVHAGRTILPDGRSVPFVTGLPSVWNEAIGGWKKRLPTNRQNPYPKPDSLLDIGTTGVLKSYDCRHLSNPLYLPPTGSGTPPCLTQGPWEFNGKRQYFPHLEEAAP